MNKQKLIDEITTEIDRLSKARDLLKGGGGDAAAFPTNDQEALVTCLADHGPLRRGQIINALGWSPSHLAQVISATETVRAYGKGWVALVDNEKTA